MSARVCHGALSLLFLLGCVDACAQSAKSVGRFAAPLMLERVDTTIKWAQPLEGGKVRVLMVAPEGAMRDADELEARLECELTRVALPARNTGLLGESAEVIEAQDAADMTPVAAPEATAPPAAPAEWIEALRAALAARPDVVVIGNVEIKGVPSDLQDNIVALAQSGVGVLLSNVLLDGGPLDTFLGQLNPAIAPTKSIAAGAAPTPIQSEKPLSAFLHAVESDTARAVVIDGPGDPPLTHALLPPPPDDVYLEDAWREDAWSLVLRALRWAARREPEVAIAAMMDTSPKGPNEEEIPPDLPGEFVQSMRDAAFNLPLHPISVQLAAPAPRAMEAVLQLRRRGEARHAYETTARIAKGADTFSTQLLINPGEFEVDCFLQGHKGVADWWTLPLTVSGWPEAEDLKADKVFLLPNDTLTLSARVRPVFGASRIGTLYARALDPEGDLVGEARVPVDSNGGAAELRMSFADLLAPMIVVEVYAFEGDTRRYGKVELASSGAQVLRFPVRQLRRAPRFELIVDAPPRDEFNARWYLEKWRANGAGMLHTGGGGAGIVRAAELGLAFLPALARYAPDAHDNETKPCLSDKDFLSRERKRIAEDIPQYWAGGGGAYTLGWPAFHADGPGGENPCESDSCIDAFHGWLARHYVDVNALNAAWGTKWGSLDEVAPPDLAACQDAHNPAPWMNWRAAMDEVFASALSSARSAVHGVDHNAAVGIVALDDADARRGYDFAALSRAIDFVAAPPAFAAPDKLRSFRAQEVWGGVAAPAIADASHGRWLAWRALLEQAPGVWIHDAVPSALARLQNSPVESGGEFSAGYAGLIDATKNIQDGVDALLLTASRARSGIAILDCRPSRLACDVDTQFGTSLASTDAWAATLRRQGFDFTFVTATEAANGALDPYRALILPLSVALNVEEAAGIAKFAQQGGALLADVVPGVYTALGDRTESPLLDEWFGVKHGAAPAAKPLDLEGQSVPADASVEATTAEVKRPGDVPAHLLVAQAKHNALLLNYVPMVDAGPWDVPVGDFLIANGCARALELADNDARIANLLTRAHFRYGKAEILALVAAPEAKKELEAKVQLSEAQHAFDLTAHMPIPHAKKTKVDLRPGDGKVLVLLPYEVTELHVEAGAIVQQGKRLDFACQIRARNAEPGKHLVRVTLSLPGGGAPLPEYTQYLPVEGGVGSGYVPIRLGQVPGMYTFRAEDLLSGQGFTHEVKIVGLSIE